MAGKKKKKVKATELKNVRLAFVSYVKEGANGLTFDIIKDKDSGIIEDECYTDLVNSVGQDGEEKPSKKTFKGMLLSLNPFKKVGDDLDKEDKIFIKEVGGMNIAKKIQETLDNINKRLSVVESNGTSSKNVSASIEALKKEAEGKEGTEKESIDKTISLMEELEDQKEVVEAYEDQITKIKLKIEDSDENDDIEVLESIVMDKEIILKSLKNDVLETEKQLKEFEKSTPDNSDANTNTDKVENEALVKLTDTLNEVSKRMETLENKRQKSNKMTLEIDKTDIANGEMDPEKEEFWKNAF